MSDFERIVVESKQNVTVDEAGSIFTNPVTYTGNGAAAEIMPYGYLFVTSADSTDPIVFEENKATGNGGAIYAATGNKTALTNVMFISNSVTTGNGGAIFNNAGVITLQDVVFNGNAASQGGAIYNNYGKIELTGNVTLSSSTDTIYNNGGSINWKLVSDTTSPDTGYLSDFSLVTNVGGTFTLTIGIEEKSGMTYTLAGNASTASETANNAFKIGIGEANTAITVNDTQALVYNGLQYKLFVDENADLILRTYTIYNRTDGTVTGTKNLDPGETYLNPSVYDGNGGAFDLTVGSTLNSIGTTDAPITITENVSTQDGGAIYNDHGKGNFDDTILSDNEAVNGGAFYNDGGTLNLTGTALADNKATQKGGAIYNTGAGTINLDNVTFDGNTASEGGAIYNANGTVNIQGTVTLENSSDTIVNGVAGTLNWDLTDPDKAANATISDYALVTNNGDLTITVSDKTYKSSPYVLAKNAATATTASKNEYTLTGLAGETDTTITVNGGAVTYGSDIYVLALDGANLTLTVTPSEPELTATLSTSLAQNDGFGWIAQGASLSISVATKYCVEASQKYTLNIDGISNEYTYSNPDTIVVDTAAEHKYTYTIVAENIVGTEAKETLAIGVDGTGPEIAAAVTADTLYVDSATGTNWIRQNDASATIKGTITDDRSGINTAKVTYDKKAYTSDSAIKLDTASVSAPQNHVFAAQDNVGNESQATVAIGIDGTGPAVGIGAISGASMYTDAQGNVWLKQGTTASLAATITETDSGLKSATYNGVEFTDGKFALDTTEEKTVTGSIVAEDNVGNTTESVQITYGVDGTGPEIGTAEITGANAYNGWVKKGSTAYASVTITDAGAGIASATMDGAAYQNERFLLKTDVATAKTAHTITAEDNVGNTSHATATYGVDGTGPVIGAVTLQGAAQSEQWFKLNSDAFANTDISDNESGFKSASLDGAEYSNKQFKLDTTAESAITDHTITASDNVNNETKATVTYGVDGTGPSIGVGQLIGNNVYGSWIKQGTAAVFNADITDAKSGLATATLNSVTYANGGFALNTAVESDITNYTIEATDMVGNKSAATVSYGIDGTGPTIGDATLSGTNVYGNWIKQGTTAFAVTEITDAKSGIVNSNAKLNGVAYADGKFILDTDDAAAVTSYDITATDNVGNTCSASVAYGIDGSGPAFGEVTLSAGANVSDKWIRQGTTAYAIVAISDDEAGLKTATLEGAEYTAGQFLLNTAETSSITAHTIYAVDNVGNATSTLVYYGVDGIGPAIGVGNITGTNVYTDQYSKVWVKKDTDAYLNASIYDSESGLNSATYNSATYTNGKFKLATNLESPTLTGKITATDMVGNESASADIAYGVDGTGPAIAEATISGENTYRNWIKAGTTAYAITSITDAKSGLKAAVLDGASYDDGKFLLDTGTTSAVTAHTITAEDNVGNASTKTVSYGIDGNGPEIGNATLTGANVSGKWIKQGSVAYATVAINDDESGFSSASMDNIIYANGKILLNTAQESGISEHTITAWDNVDNSATDTIEFGIDGSGPAIENIALSNGDNVYGSWIQKGTLAYLIADINDDKSGLATATLNGTVYRNGKFLLNTSEDSEITNYDIAASDNVGNTTTKTVGYGIDGDGPVIGDVTIVGANVYDNKWIKADTTAYAVVRITDDKSDVKGAVLDGVHYDAGKFRLQTDSSTLLADHTVTAQDNVGNISMKTITFGVDGNGPTIGEVTLEGTNVSGNWVKLGSEAYASTQINDAQSGLKSAKMDNQEYSNGQFKLATASESTITSHTITAEDNVGNTAKQTIEYGVDGTGPSIGTVTFAGTNVYGNWIKQGTEAYAVANIVDTKSGLASANLQNNIYDNGKILINTGAESSIQEYFIVAIDKVGNTNAASVRYGIDGSGPAITDVALTGSSYVDANGTAWFGKNDNAYLKATIDDDKSGFASASFNGANYATTGFAITTDTEQAAQSYSIVAYDNLGNTSEYKGISYGVDFSGPVITVTAEPATELTTCVTLSVDFQDALSGVATKEYSWDGESWLAYTGDIKVTANETLYFRSTDNVGNTSYSTYDVTNIDTALPVITITGDTNVLGPSCTLTVTATKNATLTYQDITTGEWLPVVDNTVVVGQNGVYNFQADDGIGNIGTNSITIKNILKGEPGENIVIDGEEFIIPDGMEYSIDSITIKNGGKLVLGKGAKLTVNNLYLDKGTVDCTDGTFIVNTLFDAQNEDNYVYGLITGTEKTSTNFHEDSILTMDKDQFDAIMKYWGNPENLKSLKKAGITLVFDGHVEVTPVEGNRLVQSDIVGMQNRKRAFDVNFQQALEDFKEFTFTDATNPLLKIGFTNATGNSQQNKLVFQKNAKVELGTAGSTIAFGTNTNSITIKSNADVTINSVIKRIVNITIGNGVTAKANAEDSFKTQLYTKATFNDDITTPDSIASKIAVGNYVNVAVNGDILTAKGKKNTLKIGSNSTFDVGTIVNINTITLASGKLYKMTTKSTRTQGYTTLNADSIENDYQNTKITIGNYSIVNVGDISLDLKHDFTTNDRDDTINIQQHSTLNAGHIKMGSGNNSLVVGKYSFLTAQSVITGYDKDKIEICDYATANIHGIISLNSVESAKPGKDSISIGRGAKAILKVYNPTELNSFTIGSYAIAYLNSELYSLVNDPAYKNFKVADNTTNIYDIGDLNTALAFTNIRDEKHGDETGDHENIDDSFDVARELEGNTYTGWLCGENSLDFCDYIKRGDAESITWSNDAGTLVLTQFDANGNELTRNVVGGEVTFMAETDTFSISFANGFRNSKATAYTIALA